MRRTLQYKITEDGYGCFEDDKLIFEVPKDSLEFNVKNFYEAFYGEGKDIDDIVLENMAYDDKAANRVFNCIFQLISKIKEKMAELPDAEEEQADDVEE